jgi:GNAT superfamily N-acetyltransferase
MVQPLRFELAPKDFADWSGLHALLTDCFAYMHDRIDPPSSLTRMSPDDLRRKADEEVLVLLRSRRAVVGCGFLKEKTDAIYLGKVAVRPAFRRGGGLKMIVGIAEGVARERNKCALELETRVELVENHYAFRALGFARTALNCHPGFDRPTYVTMTKPVSMSALPLVVPSTHNGGPLLEDPPDHIPPWGKRGLRTFFAWRTVHRQVWGQPSRETVLRRLRKARACGLTYEEYTSVLLDTGRHLQPADTALIAEIIARRRS